MNITGNKPEQIFKAFWTDFQGLRLQKEIKRDQFGIKAVVFLK